MPISARGPPHLAVPSLSLIYKGQGTPLLWGPPRPRSDGLSFRASWRILLETWGGAPWPLVAISPYPPAPRPHASVGWAVLGAGGEGKGRRVGFDPIVSTLGQMRTIPIFGSGYSYHLLLGLLGPGVRESAKKPQPGRGRESGPQNSIHSVRPGESGYWSLPISKSNSFRTFAWPRIHQSS